MGYADVAEARESAEFAAEMVRASTPWESTPGSGLSVAGHRLVVTHTAGAHAEIGRVLAALRATR